MAKKDIEKSEEIDLKKLKEEDNTIVEIENEGSREDYENEEVKLLKEQLENQRIQMEEMQKVMKSMIDNSNNISSNNTIVKESETEIEIGTYMIQGIGFTSRDETVQLLLSYGEIQTLGLSEIKKLLRQSEIRKLFEYGVCFFKNIEDYSLLGIKNYIDLSDEFLIDLINKKDINVIIREMNNLTSDLKNAVVTNCIIYRICNMIKNNQLANLDYYTRKELEEYFGLPFERGIKTLSDLNRIRG